MTWAASSTPTGVERHICTGESGIVLKRLRDQRIGSMRHFDHVANRTLAKIRIPPSTPWIIAGASACSPRCFNLVINIRAGAAVPALHLEPLVGPKGVYTHRTSH
jgi:hypothetical protein